MTLTKASKTARWIIFLLLAGLGLRLAYIWWTAPYTPPRIPEQVMEDTLQINQGRIPDSGERRGRL